MGLLGFHFYKVPDQMDSVCELANWLIFANDKKNVVKLAY